MPDALIPRCSSVVQKDGTVMPLSSADPSQIESVKNNWPLVGQRVMIEPNAGKGCGDRG